MKISVIVPVYNVEKYISKSVSSILNQSYKDIEVILVDDGSTDRSGEICDEFAKKDERIVVIHKKNGGASDARNYGLDFATGECIGFVDADDYIDEDMYEKMMLVLKQYDADIVTCGNIVHDKDSSVCMYCDNDKSLCFDKLDAYKNLFQKKYIDISCCTKLFRKSSIGKERYKVGIHTEDLHFLYRIINQSKKIAYVGRPFYHIICRENSSSRVSYNSHILDPLKTLSEIKAFIYDNYSTLCKEVDNFYVIWYIDTYRALCRNVYLKKYKIERRLIRKKIRKSIFSYLTNIYIDKIYKFLCIGLSLNLFKFFDKILIAWNKIKNRK